MRTLICAHRYCQREFTPKRKDSKYCRPWCGNDESEMRRGLRLTDKESWWVRCPDSQSVLHPCGHKFCDKMIPLRENFCSMRHCQQWAYLRATGKDKDPQEYLALEWNHFNRIGDLDSYFEIEDRVLRGITEPVIKRSPTINAAELLGMSIEKFARSVTKVCDGDYTYNQTTRRPMNQIHVT